MMRSVAAPSMLLSAALLSAQTTTGNGAFSVDVKATPAAQLSYASALDRDASLTRADSPQKLSAVAKAAAAYDVILAKWPERGDYVERACAEKAHLFLNASLFQNSATTCRSLDAKVAAGADDGVRLMRYRGEALTRLGRYDDAEREFDAIEHSSRFPRLNAVERGALLHDRAELAEKRGRFGEASAFLRRLARLDGTSPSLAGITLLRSLETNMRGSNSAEARTDLRDLDAAIDAAWRQNPTPEDAAALKMLEASSKHWHGKLK